MSDDALAEPEMTVSFQVAYEGDPSAHAMDVQSLAPALLAFGEIIREANALLNAGRSTVNLRVVSDFEHKCFNINFDLVMSFYEHIKTILRLEDVVAAHDLLQWLEILGVPTSAVGLLGWLRIRRGRPIKNVTKLTSPDQRGMVSIEFGDGTAAEHIEIHNHVYQLGENKSVLRAVARALQPITEGKDFDRVEFRQNDVPRVVTIKQDDAKDIQKTCDLAIVQPEPSKPQPVEAVLQALAPVDDLPYWAHPREYYGSWAGNPKGRPVDTTRCRAVVQVDARSPLFHQCVNRAGKGPDGLYCAVHARSIARFIDKRS